MCVTAPQEAVPETQTEEDAAAKAAEAARAEALEKFKRGELVWSKIYGFPHWPSEVRCACDCSQAKSTLPTVPPRVAHIDRHRSDRYGR